MSNRHKREREREEGDTSSWSKATDAFEGVAANKALPCQNKRSTLDCCVSNVLCGGVIRLLFLGTHQNLIAGGEVRIKEQNTIERHISVKT